MKPTISEDLEKLAQRLQREAQVVKSSGEEIGDHASRRLLLVANEIIATVNIYGVQPINTEPARIPD